jgi:hypothetical protein
MFIVNPSIDATRVDAHYTKRISSVTFEIDHEEQPPGNDPRDEKDKRVCQGTTNELFS